MSHEIHVQKAKTRVCSGLVDLHQRFLVIDGGIFIQPRVEILHAPQAERERCSGLRPYQRVKSCRFLYTGYHRAKTMSTANVQLM